MLFRDKKLYAMMALAVLAGTGCNGSDSSSDSSSNAGGDTTSGFPSFYTLTKEALPSTGSGADAALTRRVRAAVGTPGPSTFPETFTTDSSEFTTAFSLEQNYIGQVLNDAGESGPVKSMFVLLAQADSIMDDINNNFSDAEGAPTNCTAIASTATVLTPFFSGATTAAFNSWDDADKYTCYVENDSGLILFGRQAITAPAEGCTDAFEYYVMSGYSVDDQENTEQVEVRGTTIDLSAISKFYYNGCSKDLKLAFAHSSLYSAGVEFSSRSEILGNAADHTFSVRSNYIDADTSYANHITITGTGTSKLAEGATEAAVHFVMGYRSDNCGDSSDSSVCSEGTAKTFCVKNAGTSNNYALETDTAQCDDMLPDYSAITPLVRSDIPSGYFDTSAGAFGLVQ